MQEKLRDFLNSEGLKPSQFADMLGVNPAGISHLLAGRNKPGYELLQKMLRRFPQLNPDWLLLDQGPMYRSEGAASAPTTADTSSSSSAGDLFAAPSAEASRLRPTPADEREVPAELPTVSPRSGARASRIVICYDDGSFESFTTR